MNKIKMTATNTAAVSVMKKLFPLLDRVLVKRIEGPTKTPGGLMIPHRVLNKIQQGEVVAVGPGSRASGGEFIPVLLKVGDKVILPEHGGTRVAMENDDKEYQLYREADILARIDDEKILEAPTVNA